jgi:hypothetical protein
MLLRAGIPAAFVLLASLFALLLNDASVKADGERIAVNYTKSDDAAEDAGELQVRFSFCGTSVPRALGYALETAFSARPEAYRRGRDEAWARMGLVNCDEVQRAANGAAR